MSNEKLIRALRKKHELSSVEHTPYYHRFRENYLALYRTHPDLPRFYGGDNEDFIYERFLEVWRLEVLSNQDDAPGDLHAAFTSTKAQPLFGHTWAVTEGISSTTEYMMRDFGCYRWDDEYYTVVTEEMYREQDTPPGMERVYTYQAGERDCPWCGCGTGWLEQAIGNPALEAEHAEYKAILVEMADGAEHRLDLEFRNWVDKEDRGKHNPLCEICLGGGVLYEGELSVIIYRVERDEDEEEKEEEDEYEYEDE